MAQRSDAPDQTSPFLFSFLSLFLSLLKQNKLPYVGNARPTTRERALETPKERTMVGVEEEEINEFRCFFSKEVVAFFFFDLKKKNTL